MKKTTTHLNSLFKHYCTFGIGMVCLLLITSGKSFAQKMHKIPGQAGTYLHINESSKYTQTKRTDGIGNYMLKIKLSVHHIEGNTHYRGFPLDNTQHPISLSFDVKVANDKGLTFSSNQVKASKQSYGYEYKVSFKDASTSTKKITVSNIKARYSQTNRGSSQKQLIDKYYASVNTLNGYLQTFPSLNYTDADRLTNTQHKLHDIRHGFDNINNYHFITALKLDQRDPANLRKKLRRTTRLLTEAEQRFHVSEQKWHALYYQKFLSTGQTRYLDLALSKNKRYALPYLEKSSIALKNNHPDDAIYQLELMHKNANTSSSLATNATRSLYQKIFDYYVNQGKRQSHYQDKIRYYEKARSICGKPGASINNCDGRARSLITAARTQHYESHLNRFNNQLQHADFSNAYQSLQKAEQFQQRYPQISNHHSALYQRLYNSIVQKAQSHVRNHHHQQALNELGFAEQIAREKNNVNATMAYQEVKTAAHTSIFEQKFNRARQAVASGDFNNATKHLRAANSYHTTYQRFIRNQHEKKQQVVQQYEALLGKTVNRGKGFNTQKQFDRGLADFKLAKDLFGDVGSRLPQQTAIRNDIELGLATAYVGLAINDNTNKSYQQSLNRLALAETAIASVNGQQDRVGLLQKDIAQYKKDAIQRIISQRIDRAHAILKRDKLQEAMSISSGILSFTNKYNYALSRDEGLSKRYEVLKKAIFDKECELNQRAYNQLLQQARTNFDQQDFIKGWRLLEQAIGKADANKACNINSQMAQQLKTRYKNAYQYDLDWEKITKFSGSGQRSAHEKAVNLHYQVANNYKQYNLKIFGIKTPDLKRFFEEHSNVLFWTYGIIHYLGAKNQDRDFSTKLMNKYIRQKPSRSNIRSIAYEMAAIDFKQDAQRMEKNRYKTFFKKYDLVSDRSYKRRVKWVRKAYYKQWNRMRKR